jgi:putative endonuclease
MRQVVQGTGGSAGETGARMRNREVGLAGEDAACTFLEHKGYRILDRNYRCPSGELDIIAAKQGQLVFCEVKARTGGDLEEALGAVDQKRQARMARAASHYLAEERRAARSCRFDVIALLKCGAEWKIVHVEDAFEIGEL